MTVREHAAVDSPPGPGPQQPALIDQPGEPESPPVSPFTLLRVAYGMLLGVEDFRTILGYARGKHVLHQSWLHGTGVVWGYGLSVNSTELVIRRGMAVDGLGRELLLDGDRCIDVSDWLQTSGARAVPVHTDEGVKRQVVLDVVARAGYRLTDPVPALVNPADPSRRTDDYSRFREDVVLDLLAPQEGVQPSAAFHRVRVLFGLDRVGDDDPDGSEAAREAAVVAALPAEERPAALLAAMRRMARLDVVGRVPFDAPGVPMELQGPVAGAGVVLARITIRLLESGRVDVLPPDWGPRTDLLPTALLQDLTCGAAPLLIQDSSGDGPVRRGPRVVLGSVRWDSDHALSLATDGALRPRSLSADVVHVSSVSTEGEWVREQIEAVEYQDADDGGLISVQLQTPPTHELVRILIRGTGATPVVGVGGLPLAGVDSGVASNGVDERPEEGRDAIVQIGRTDDDEH